VPALVVVRLIHPDCLADVGGRADDAADRVRPVPGEVPDVAEDALVQEAWVVGDMFVEACRGTIGAFLGGGFFLLGGDIKWIGERGVVFFFLSFFSFLLSFLLTGREGSTGFPRCCGT